jgi:TPR repeat protein
MHASTPIEGNFMIRLKPPLAATLAILGIAFTASALAASSLQTCHDHWKALEQSSRKQNDSLTGDYALRAAKDIAEALLDKTGQPPAADTELYKGLLKKWPGAIEKDIPKGCRVIEGVGAFEDSAFMRKTRKEIKDTLGRGDFDKVVPMARMFADKGDAEAQLVLGKVYQRGGGRIQQDLAEAVKWFGKAAHQGNAKAQLKLGLAHAKGLGVAQDAVEGVKWIRKAAEGGDGEARILLSQAYLNGIGVTKDAIESTNWLRKASERGNHSAQAMLGERYANGVGVKRDLMMAYMWLDIASTWANIFKGPNDAAIPALRDRVAKVLKPDELDKARKWGGECGTRHYRNCVDMDTDIAAKEKSAAELKAQLDDFVRFLDGPWGRATSAGEAMASQKITLVDGQPKIQFGRKACPADGLASPADMDDGEHWYERKGNGDLQVRHGKWGGGETSTQGIHFVRFKDKDTVVFTIDNLPHLLTRVGKDMMKDKVDLISGEYTFVRCKRK